MDANLYRHTRFSNKNVTVNVGDWVRYQRTTENQEKFGSERMDLRGLVIGVKNKYNRHVKVLWTKRGVEEFMVSSATFNEFMETYDENSSDVITEGRPEQVKVLAKTLIASDCVLHPATNNWIAVREINTTQDGRLHLSFYREDRNPDAIVDPETLIMFRPATQI